MKIIKFVERKGSILSIMGVSLSVLGAWIKSIHDKKVLEKTIETIVDAKLNNK